MATSIPPHNAAELCDGGAASDRRSEAPIEALMSSDADDGLVPGPDFPTGGIIVDSRESILEAYKTGRGGFRVRARWEKEDQGRGTWTSRRHRNSLSGAEGAADREDRRAADGPQAAAARGRPRRERRRHPHRAGAEEPHGRSRRC